MKVKTMDDSSNCETPNRILSEQNALKPSFRSKTIQNSTNLKRNNQRKLLRHKSVEERSLGLYGNTFSSFPLHKTPPSAVKRSAVFNPFNVGLRERLENCTVSPNVFSTVISPSQESSEEMRWTIEDLSHIKPAPIEENVEPLSEPDDPQVQEVIEKYFSETHMVPSPFDAPRDWVPRGSVGTPLLVKLSQRAVASTPRDDFKGTVQTRDVLVQTALSLPPNLPKEVEAVLRPFFNTEEQDSGMDESNFNVSSMRRKLFFQKDDEQLSPVKRNNDTIFQKSEPFTPVSPSQQVGRHFTPIASSQELIQPDLSPISSMERSSISMSKTRARLEFTDTCDNLSSKKLSGDHDPRVDVDNVIDANSLIDEPMMISVIDVTKVRGMKKENRLSDRDETTSLNKDQGVSSVPEDTGYQTNEDMSWRPIHNREKIISSLPIGLLVASTPTKKTDEIF